VSDSETNWDIKNVYNYYKHFWCSNELEVSSFHITMKILQIRNACTVFVSNLYCYVTEVSLTHQDIVRKLNTLNQTSIDLINIGDLAQSLSIFIWIYMHTWATNFHTRLMPTLLLNFLVIFQPLLFGQWLIIYLLSCLKYNMQVGKVYYIFGPKIVWQYYFQAN